MNIAEIKNKIFDWYEPECLFFWGPQNNGTEITESCLSQWYQLEFVVDGITYANMEQYMMSEKSRLFYDIESYRLIMNTCQPNVIKQLGRKVKNFDAKIWDEHKIKIVEKGNFQKFYQNAELREFLLDTGDRILVEASPYDKIWGIGLAKEDKRAMNVATWQGENLLGFALMNVGEMLY